MTKKTNIFDEYSSVDEIRAMLKGTKVHATIVQKGGTGKTSMTSNIGYVLAKRGFKVLLIDSDSQSSLTDLCNLMPAEYIGTEDFHIDGLHTLYDLYVERLESEGKGWISYDEIKNVIVRPKYNDIENSVVVGEDGKKNKEIVLVEKEFGFDLIPADFTLGNSEIELSIRGKVFVLTMIVNILKEQDDYDFIIIDCPPGLGTLAYNAIGASTDGCLVPVNLEALTIRGARNLIRTVAEVQDLLWNSRKERILHKGILGIIKNKYAPKLTTQRTLNETVDTLFPIPSFETSIPNYSTCDKAHMVGQLYSQLDSRAMAAFDSLCSEIVNEDIRRTDETEPIIFRKFGEDFSPVQGE